MSILWFFILIPVLTISAIVMTRDNKSARVAAACGMFLQLLMAVTLLFMYFAERKSGNTADILFLTDYVWFQSLNIHFLTGVDGIAVAMIMLTSVVVFAGIFASWEMEDLSREFFISLIVLATGVFGFFISLDLFTMFMFYELAVIPMYLLIGIWGSGPKEYSAMKLTLMLMGGSALLAGWITGNIFQFCTGWRTAHFQHYADSTNPIASFRSTIFFPIHLCWFWGSWSLISAAYMVTRWSCFGTHRSFYAACRCADETGRIRML